MIKYDKNHKNSQGEPAPWTVVSHKDGHVISSHKTEEDAKRKLQLMHIFKK